MNGLGETMGLINAVMLGFGLAASNGFKALVSNQISEMIYNGFDQSAALGFIKLWGLPLQTQTNIQMLPESQSAPMLPQAPEE